MIIRTTMLSLCTSFMLLACDRPTPPATPVVEITEEAAGPWETATSADEGFFVRWRLLVPEVPLADPFDIEVEVWTDETMREPAVFDRLYVDAGMPHHRHGMNVVPEIESRSPGRWVARGMLLHMPGRWQFYVDVLDDGRIERAQWSTWLSG